MGLAIAVSNQISTSSAIILSLLIDGFNHGLGGLFFSAIEALYTANSGIFHNESFIGMDSL